MLKLKKMLENIFFCVRFTKTHSSRGASSLGGSPVLLQTIWIHPASYYTITLRISPMHSTGQHRRNSLSSFVYNLSFWSRLKWENKGICGRIIFWNADWYFSPVFPFISWRSHTWGFGLRKFSASGKGCYHQAKSVRTQNSGPWFYL